MIFYSIQMTKIHVLLSSIAVSMIVIAMQVIIVFFSESERHKTISYLLLTGCDQCENYCPKENNDGIPSYIIQFTSLLFNNFIFQFFPQLLTLVEIVVQFRRVSVVIIIIQFKPKFYNTNIVNNIIYKFH